MLQEPSVSVSINLLCSHSVYMATQYIVFTAVKSKVVGFHIGMMGRAVVINQMFELCHEKPGLLDTNFTVHRRWLEACNFGFRK